ncbi:hypothetical protein LIER_26523 [Lithospermum erythrorhizon]|uniref:Uncharacterized protein n=1 Tax=Lithospermum erythrorhizon TaxID=34254 RepID=A0AAV3RAR1_LITER
MSTRIKRAASKSRFHLREGLIQPSFKNATIIRGGKPGDKEVLSCYVLHENELQALITWREIEFQRWTPFFTLKRRGLTREDGRLTWVDKRARDARKRQRQEDDDDENSDELPRRSIHDKLNALEEGQAKLHQEVQGL